MDFITRNLYSSSSEYLIWASEGLLSWAVKILGHIGRIIFSDRILKCAEVEHSPSMIRKRAQKKEFPFDEEACEQFFYELTKIDEERLEYGDLEDLAAIICPNKDSTRSFNVIIILSYKMRARSFVSWTKTEWLRGMGELKIHSLEQLIAQRDELLSLMNDEILSRDIWRYCYDAGKGDTKDMGIPFVKALADAFSMKEWTLYNQFFKYLEIAKIKSLTKDQFCSLYDFQRSVNTRQEIVDYDFEGAWPTLLDEFIESFKQESDLFCM